MTPAKHFSWNKMHKNNTFRVFGLSMAGIITADSQKASFFIFSACESN